MSKLPIKLQAKYYQKIQELVSVICEFQGTTALPTRPYLLTHAEPCLIEFSIVFWIYPKSAFEYSVVPTPVPIKTLLYKGEGKTANENVTAIYLNSNYTVTFVTTTTSGQR